MSYQPSPALFSGPQLRPNWPFGALEPMSYGLIMIDPPWSFETYSAKGEAKGPAAQYSLMDADAIRALPVGTLAARDCLLWLWATWPTLPVAMSCFEAWGFAFKTGGAWDKQRWGTGYLMRSLCEPFLIGTCGEPRVRGASIPNLIEETRREHSAKPNAAYTMAERMLPDARRVELFSRRTRPGWDAWGNEAGKLDT